MLFEPSPIINGRIRERLPDMQPHLQPLWSAVLQGCTFAMIAQGDGAFRIPDSRPVVAVIGDDLATAKGPAGFNRRSMRRFLSRCSAVCIVTSEPVPGAYAGVAARAIRQRQDVAIVESRPEHEGTWLGLVQGAAPLASVLLCRPMPSAGVH